MFEWYLRCLADVWGTQAVLEWYLGRSRCSKDIWVKIVLMMIIQVPPTWRLQEAENKMHFILVAPFPQNCNHPHTACKCFSRNQICFSICTFGFCVSVFCIVCFCICILVEAETRFSKTVNHPHTDCECFSGVQLLCFWFLRYDDLCNEFCQSVCQKI